VENSNQRKSLSQRVFSESWVVFSKYWKLFISLAAIQAVVEFLLLNAVFSDVRTFFYTDNRAENVSELIDSVPSDFSLYISVSLIIGTIIAGAFLGSLISIIRDDKEVEIPEAIKKGLDNFWPLFSVGLVVGLIVILGLSLFVLPGAIASVILMFAFHARLDRELSIIDSMKESYRIVRVDWKQLVIVIVGLLAVAIAADIVARALSSSLNDTGSSAITLLTTIPSTSLMIVVFTKTYFALKKTKGSDK